MRTPLAVILAFSLSLLSTSVSLQAKPPSQEEVVRQAALIEQHKALLAAESTPAGKLSVLKNWLKEPLVEVRRQGLERAQTALSSPEIDALLTGVLAGDEDAGIRSAAATALGKLGSEKSLAALTRAAGNDPTTKIEIGCIVGQSSARRAASFAVADLAARFPNLADSAAQELRALKVKDDPADGEQLADVRMQALYRITHEAALLKPFLERLRSADPKTRTSGVVAFRFFGLTAAPAELTACLKDSDKEVRSWVILVLGEIRDPRSGPVLLTLASDAKEEQALRSRALYALGQMRAKEVVPQLRKLLEDEQEAIQVAAAIALNRITGERVKQFPEGYPVEPPGCQ